MRREGHANSVEYLVSMAPSTRNGQDALGRTPLHLSAKHGFTNCVDLLVSLGSDVSSRCA